MAEFINSINYKKEAEEIVTSISTNQLRDYVVKLKDSVLMNPTQIYLYNIWMGSLDYCLEELLKNNKCRSCKRFIIYCKDEDKANHLYKFIRKCATVYIDSTLEVYTNESDFTAITCGKLHKDANWWWCDKGRIFINLNKLKSCKEYVLATDISDLNFSKEYSYLTETSYGF